MTFAERLIAYEDSLNDTDDAIADYLRQHRGELERLSIQKLAATLYTVPNTLVRFAKKLHYTGFAELKVALRAEYDAPAGRVEVPINIQKTLEMLDEGQMAAVARRLKRARRVYFYGIGNTNPFCETMAHYLKCTGKTAESFDYRHDMYYSADHAEPGDLVFVISVSGETDQLIKAVQMAKARGAYCVSLTSLCRNTLAQMADCRLYCYTQKMEIEGYEVSDRVPVMLVLRRLAEQYWALFDPPIGLPVK